MNPEEIEKLFQSCVSGKLSKNDTIMKLAQVGKLDITAAVREYQRLAKASGIVLGTKERTERIDAILAENDITDAAVRKELIAQLADDFDISEATAGAHIRKYAEKADIDMPSQHRNSLNDMVKFVKELHKAGKERADIVTALTNEMGYTANSAASAYSRATRELGISTGRTSSSVPIAELVAFVREHDGMQRKTLVKKMAEELGYAESTANSFLTYVNFAKEWAAQELAEQASKQAATKQTASKQAASKQAATKQAATK